MGQDDVRRERDQFRRISANVVGIAGGPADVDPHVAADRSNPVHQRLQECADPGLKFRIVRGCRQQHADAPHALALLRMRSERPRCRATQKTEKLPPPHVGPQAQEAVSYRLKRAL